MSRQNVANGIFPCSVRHGEMVLRRLEFGPKQILSSRNKRQWSYTGLQQSGRQNRGSRQNQNRRTNRSVTGGEQTGRDQAKSESSKQPVIHKGNRKKMQEGPYMRQQRQSVREGKGKQGLSTWGNQKQVEPIRAGKVITKAGIQGKHGWQGRRWTKNHENKQKTHARHSDPYRKSHCLQVPCLAITVIFIICYKKRIKFVSNLCIPLYCSFISFTLWCYLSTCFSSNPDIPWCCRPFCTLLVDQCHTIIRSSTPHYTRTNGWLLFISTECTLILVDLPLNFWHLPTATHLKTFYKWSCNSDNTAVC